MAIVLVVDDHPEVRRLLSISLGKAHQMLEAENGVAALEAIRRHQPTVVLLDVMMQGDIDGLQVLEHIKTNPLTRATLVAMISARGQEADCQEAQRRGADAYFVKPFSPLAVVKWVREQLAAIT
jgi:CheY-like chemotaxis protein